MGEARRVLIADDEEPMRLLMRTLLELTPQVEVVAEARDGAGGGRACRRAAPVGGAAGCDDAAAGWVRRRRADPLPLPDTGVLLHTAQFNADAQQRAAALGVPLIDKLKLTGSVEQILDAAQPGDGEPIEQAVETLVLMAVAARTGDAVVIVDAGRQVVFYNAEAAALLGLPLPARPLPLDQLWSATHAVYPDGRPRPAEQRPLAVALETRKRTSDEVLWRIGDNQTLHRHRVTAIPFFDEDASFLGVGNYLTPLD